MTTSDPNQGSPHWPAVPPEYQPDTGCRILFIVLLCVALLVCITAVALFVARGG